ncbi:hypothetical protein J7443_23470 [Tropicibacter sp. R15_0]|uniref:hypothetical protein n=1 Tax=Tropicibacter sp. R15_0 TaxID=2821101 RepID=UPI001ADD3BC8|nr:hypothetical protein [Tropicibacter sp. R15_0]MBO9468206.1 hypothetical protein [Tropicibacter sp. R15_0]
MTKVATKTKPENQASKSSSDKEENKKISVPQEKQTALQEPVEGETIYEFRQDGSSQEAKGNSKTRTFPFKMLLETHVDNGKTVKVPKKLGDGNFGMVFEVTQPKATNTSFALKVLYEHRAGATGDDKKKKAELDRVRAELQVGINIPKEIDRHLADFLKVDPTFPKTGPAQLARLVAPLAYSESFDQFEGCDTLAAQDIRFSTFAYLMEKCDESLKDQVERSDTSGAAAAGYGRLKAAPKTERVKSALPVARQIAQGLQILHAAGLRHQDIKPANIYYTAGTNGVSYRLGDMGFLLPHDPKLAGTVAASLDAIGIGTKHYRSIEQVDFNDTAECTIQVDDKNKDRARLVTYDPKFRKTIIRRGDIAVLAKSATHRLLIVHHVEHDEESTKTTIDVELVRETRRGLAGKPEGKFLTNDSKTQVSFFKNPSAKTDLFGLGAIVYDIITAGDSPERFYELLRRFDTHDGSTDRIVENYSIWKNGFLDDPDMAAIFTRINGGADRTEVLDERVLRFVLRSMMSDATDSFFQRFDFEDYVPGENQTSDEENARSSRVKTVAGWRKVILGLGQMLEDFRALRYDDPAVNLLTKTVEETDLLEPDPGAGSMQSALSKVIASYRLGEPIERREGFDKSVTQAERQTYRWLISSALLQKLVSEIRNLTDKSTSMVSLSPEHLTVENSNIRFGPHLFSKAKPLYRQLLSRDPMLTRIRPFSSRFEPIWWRYATRRIHVTKFEKLREADQSENPSVEKSVIVEKKPGQGSSDLPQTLETTEPESSHALFRVKYEHVDFAFAPPRFEKGDYLIPGHGVREVFEIVKTEGAKTLILRSCEDRELQVSNDQPHDQNFEESFEQAHLLKSPVPVDYYAGMLAIYMYQLLFAGGVGQPEELEDLPNVLLSNVPNFPIQFHATPAQLAPPAKRQTAERFRDHTIRLIVWLSLGGYKYAEDDATKSVWNRIQNEFVEWLSAKEALVGNKGDLMGIHLTGQIGFDVAKETCKNSKSAFIETTLSEWEKSANSYLRGQTGEKATAWLGRWR